MRICGRAHWASRRLCDSVSRSVRKGSSSSSSSSSSYAVAISSDLRYPNLHDWKQDLVGVPNDPSSPSHGQFLGHHWALLPQTLLLGNSGRGFSSCIELESDILRCTPPSIDFRCPFSTQRELDRKGSKEEDDASRGGKSGLEGNAGDGYFKEGRGFKDDVDLATGGGIGRNQSGWTKEVVNWPNTISIPRLLSGPLLAWMIVQGLTKLSPTTTSTMVQCRRPFSSAQELNSKMKTAKMMRDSQTCLSSSSTFTESSREEFRPPAPVEIPEPQNFETTPLASPMELPQINDPEQTCTATPIEVPQIEQETFGNYTSRLPSGQTDAASSTRISHKSSIDEKETAKFAAIAATWWDHKGPYKPLHIMNPTRVSFIRSALCKYFRKDANTARPLNGLQILDVGCGGGLVCEPLARMGGQVTGVDAVEENIGVAAIHAARDPATSSIKYICSTAEQLVQEEQKFDVVLALEIIEHVADPEEFCKSLAALAKKDGLVFVSTLNRSLPSFGLAIVAAEYILGWLPQGTHDWSKFLTPQELSVRMEKASISVEEVTGMVYNPLTQKWSLSPRNTSVNYIAYGVNRSGSV